MHVRFHSKITRRSDIVFNIWNTSDIMLIHRRIDFAFYLGEYELMFCIQNNHAYMGFQLFD